METISQAIDHFLLYLQAKDSSPHTLRQSFATHLMQRGAGIRDVQELLGHASIATTGIYTHMAPAGLIDSYNRAHPRAG